MAASWATACMAVPSRAGADFFYHSAITVHCNLGPLSYSDTREVPNYSAFLICSSTQENLPLSNKIIPIYLSLQPTQPFYDVLASEEHACTYHIYRTVSMINCNKQASSVLQYLQPRFVCSKFDGNTSIITWHGSTRVTKLNIV